MRNHRTADGVLLLELHTPFYALAPVHEKDDTGERVIGWNLTKVESAFQLHLLPNYLSVFYGDDHYDPADVFQDEKHMRTALAVRYAGLAARAEGEAGSVTCVLAVTKPIDQKTYEALKEALKKESNNPHRIFIGPGPGFQVSHAPPGWPMPEGLTANKHGVGPDTDPNPGGD